MNNSTGVMFDCGDGMLEANCTAGEGTEPPLPASPSGFAAWLRFSIVSQILMVGAIFLTNGAVLVLVARHRRLRVLDHSFVVSLAAADWLLSLAMVPGVDITLHPARASEKYTCLLLWCSIMFTSSASVFSLLVLSLDRYLKIVYPLHHYMTGARAAGLLAFVWAYTFLTAFLLPFAGLNSIPDGPFVCFDFKEVFNLAYLQFYCYVNGLVPFGVMFAMYGKIFAVVLEKLRQTAEHQPASSAASGPSGGAGGPGGAQEGVAGLQHRYRRELKTAKRLSLLLGTTTVSWLPTTCMLLRQIYQPSYVPSFETRVMLSTMTYMNSFVNPLLYALRLQPFREALAGVLCRPVNGQNAVHPS